MDVLSVCYPRLKDFHLFKCALSKMAKRPLAIAGVVASTPVPCCHVKFILNSHSGYKNSKLSLEFLEIK